MINFNYTINKDLKINKKIADDLKSIVNGIIKIIGDYVISIYLVGGFGRGEGSVYIDNENIKIVNDYDLLIVVKQYSHVKKKYIKSAKS